MRRAIRMIAVMLVLAIAAVSFSACTSEKAVLKVGTNAEFPPFEYTTDGGAYAGIDMDIVNAIGEDLGMTIEIVNMKFESLPAALTSGDIDVIAAAFSADPEREEQMDFTTSYWAASQAILVLNANTAITKKADLANQKLGAQEGTTGFKEIEKLTSSANGYSNGATAILDMRAGKIDAIVIDNFTAIALAEKNSDCKVIEGQFESEDYVLAVKKGNTDLQNKLNTSLEKLINDGKITEYVKAH